MGYKFPPTPRAGDLYICEVCASEMSTPNCTKCAKRTTEHKTGNTVDHPAHYNLHPSGVECIVVTEHMTFNIGNAIKYLWRCDYKNGIQDLEKAIWYIQREIGRVASVSKGEL